MLGHLVRRRESAILAALVVLIIAIGAAEPNFVSGSNLYLLSRQISYVAIVALGAASPAPQALQEGPNTPRDSIRKQLLLEQSSSQEELGHS